MPAIQQVRIGTPERPSLERLDFPQPWVISSEITSIPTFKWFWESDLLGFGRKCLRKAWVGVTEPGYTEYVPDMGVTGQFKATAPIHVRDLGAQFASEDVEDSYPVTVTLPSPEASTYLDVNSEGRVYIKFFREAAGHAMTGKDFHILLTVDVSSPAFGTEGEWSSWTLFKNSGGDGRFKAETIYPGPFTKD